jgi:hypothetical protein
MGFSTVLIISLAAGVILIVGGGLMMYMGNLVKSAYEIKVQINTEVEERLTKMGDDLDKKSRWIKRDLLEEIEKIKVALQTDNVRKMEELTGALRAKVDNVENLLRGERAEWVKAIDADRQAIAGLDARMKTQSKQAKKAEDAPAPAEPGTAPPASGDTKPAAAAPAEAPAKPSGPAPVGMFLQELGNGTR